MKTQTTKKTYIYEETDLTRKPDRRDQDTSDDEPSILSPPMKRKLSADSDDLQIVDMSTRRCQGVSSESLTVVNPADLCPSARTRPWCTVSSPTNSGPSDSSGVN